MPCNPLTTSLKLAHPGAILREDVLPALGLPKAEIARLIGVSRQTLYAILDEKQPITVPMALRFGKLCGDGPEIWLAMQRTFDLRQAEAQLAPIIATIPTLEAVG